MADTTTIEIKTKTWRELNALKEPGDSFDDVVQRLLADGDDDVSPEPLPPAAETHIALGDDIPQTVNDDDARRVVRAVLDVIDRQGPIERSAIVAELDGAHSLCYDVENRDGAWWSRIVAPSIKANGASHHPGDGWSR